MQDSNDSGSAYWKAKLAKKAKKVFVTKKTDTLIEVPTIGRYAIQVMNSLNEHPTGVVEASSLGELATTFAVPRKYISRALAMLTRYGLAEFKTDAPVKVTLHRERLGRSKNQSQKIRGAISAKDRARLYEADGYRCGHCGEVFEARELAIDHIVPVCFLGADEPGNWVALCHRHNSEKSDQFDSMHLRFYRRRPISGTVGVRFKDGFFWPYISGKIRTDTRESWKIRPK